MAEPSVPSSTGGKVERGGNPLPQIAFSKEQTAFMLMDEKMQDFQVLVTAEESWPAFERAILAAKNEISCGFHIFDLTTRLRSEEARAIGETWFDLIAYVVERGVPFRMVLSDFDPIFGMPLHRGAWRSKRQFVALREIVGPDAPLDMRVHQHPAQAGILPRLAFSIPALRRKSKALQSLRQVDLVEETPGLRRGGLPPFHTATHHQKMAVIDREWVYLGGLDLNERRYDSLDHDRPAEQTWADVQLLMRDPVLGKDAARHLESFVSSTEGRQPPPPMARMLRTVSCPRRFQAPFISPANAVHEIETAHLEAFGKAEQLVYAETQFFRSRRLADALAKRAQAQPGLKAVIVLPHLPDDVAFTGEADLDARFGMNLQEEVLDQLREAFGDRLTLATPVQRVMAPRTSRAVHRGSPIIYVHSKVLIVDGTEAVVGSANLNGRSMRWDTETAIPLQETRQVARLRKAIGAHWWPGLPEADVPVTDQQAVWSASIQGNNVRLPENRRGFLVSYDEAPDEDRTAIPGVTEDIV